MGGKSPVFRFASGKSSTIFIYLAKEGTTKNKHRLEVLAKNEGFSAKAHHSHNGTLVSDAHKSDCDAQNQKYILSVSGVTSSKYRVPERNTSRPLCRGLVQIYYTRVCIGLARRLSATGNYLLMFALLIQSPMQLFYGLQRNLHTTHNQ